MQRSAQEQQRKIAVASLNYFPPNENVTKNSLPTATANQPLEINNFLHSLV